MEITALGHGGARVSGSTTSGLADPWLGPAGAFAGSWFQLPANDHLATAALLTADWVAVSSLRADRLDLQTLGRIPAGTRVLLAPPVAPSVMRRLSADTGLAFEPVSPWARAELHPSGDWLMFIPGPAPASGEYSLASVLLSIGGVSVLLCGPTPPTPSQVLRARQEVGDRLDAATVQAADVSWEPLAYDEPDATLVARSAETRAARLAAVSTFLRAARPGIAVPFGGPPCFLDPELTRHNRWIAPPGILPDPEQVATWLRAALPDQAVTTLLPGDRFYPADGLTLDDPRWNSFSYARLRHYLRDYAHARAVQLSRVNAAFPEPDASLRTGFVEFLTRAIEQHPALAELDASPVRFEVTGPGGGRWDVHIDHDRGRAELRHAAVDVDVWFRVASRWLAAVLAGRISWNDLLYSLRFSASSNFRERGDHMMQLLAGPESRAGEDVVGKSTSPR
ncbi:MAG: UDP-MurNAc hydroxylase [Actinomycetota bacterium]|nr:UDP-MurNAc hydroxylase [Actinomycetota bacterium]